MSRIFFTAIIIGGLVLSSVSFGYSGGSGTPQAPYQIATKADLLTLAGTVTDYNKCFILTADIDMEGQVFTTAIIGAADFTGTFDGNNLKITNFTINGGSNNNVGLFGRTASVGSIKNLGVENCAVSGRAYVGGLVGSNFGSISNCYSTGAVSGTSARVGGLVGYSTGGNITNCYSTAAVSGSYSVGGLVGLNNLCSISQCYSTGAVSGIYQLVGGLVGTNFGSISNCYSTGSVSCPSYAGGLLGSNYDGTISSCYFLDTSGPDNGYGQPLTDEKMKQQASFTGWDFVSETTNGAEDIWRMCIDGVNYPLLWWQFNIADFTCPDGVDFIDFAIFANAWLSDSAQAKWNPRCDIAEPPDSVIDVLDLAIFAQYWLQYE